MARPTVFAAMVALKVADVVKPDNAHAHAGDVDNRRRPDVRPADRHPGGLFDDVRGEKRKPRLGRPGLQRAAGVVLRRRRRRRAADRAVVEFMVADGGGGVAERVVRGHDHLAFVQVGLERPLKQIAGIQQQHAAAVGLPGRAQIADVAVE